MLFAKAAPWSCHPRHTAFYFLSQDDLLQALPPAFGPVWHQLLDRLESSALFSEESCSFSHGDLLDSLALWLDKAELRLASAS